MSLDRWLRSGALAVGVLAWVTLGGCDDGAAPGGEPGAMDAEVPAPDGGGPDARSEPDAQAGPDAKPEPDAGAPDMTQPDAEAADMAAPDMAQPDAMPREVTYTQGGRQTPCEDYYPNRRAYFGDLHVHTAYSFDAYAHETRNDPSTAYAFARGEKVCVGDAGEVNGVERGRVPMQLRQPLDFTSVTDHAELLGEVALCTDPDSPAYDTLACAGLRDLGQQGVVLNAAPYTLRNPIRVPEPCRGDVGIVDPDNPCVIAAREPWEELLRAADMANDYSAACEFVAFVGYEWTGSPLGSTLHRNVIFRNDEVPQKPIGYFEETEPEMLRQRLDAICTHSGGRCQVLTIPHNSNASQGNAFALEGLLGLDPAVHDVVAARRARLEPLMEIFQHKGASECYYKVDQPLRRYSDDPSCEYELLGDFSFENPVVPLPVPRDYLRGALGLGLRQVQAGGINPLRLGVIASTDTHNGTPGATDERDFRGHLGATERDNVDRGDAPDGTNAGGLVGVWAVERSRDAIFEAMQRRETFGTSGTRILPRFFGGWDIPDEACDDPALFEMMYRDGRGVAMGGTLTEAPAGAAPRFVVQAVQDEVPLAATEIVKVWVDARGNTQEAIIPAAGARDNGATVDPETCERADPQARGMANTCAVVSDPSFDPGLPTAYYMRVLENPSCRFNRWRCIAQAAERAAPLGDDPLCGEPIEPPAYALPILDPCNSVDPRSVQQERAWTSPIWYEP